MESDIDVIIERIKHIAFAQLGWSKVMLAGKAEVPYSAVRFIHEKNWNPKLEQLRAMERAVKSAAVEESSSH